VSDRATWTADARALLEGSAQGVALVLDEPLSLWGGLDPHTGTIIEARHPQAGADITGRALIMPAGRGSSSSSSILAEAIRAGHGPSMIVLGEADEIIVLGALVAQLLDELTVPVLVVAPGALSRIRAGDELQAGPGGRLEVRSA
jgi:predicted aconitase with swiveling domain